MHGRKKNWIGAKRIRSGIFWGLWRNDRNVERFKWPETLKVRKMRYKRGHGATTQEREGGKSREGRPRKGKKERRRRGGEHRGRGRKAKYRGKGPHGGRKHQEQAGGEREGSERKGKERSAQRTPSPRIRDKHAAGQGPGGKRTRREPTGHGKRKRVRGGTEERRGSAKEDGMKETRGRLTERQLGWPGYDRRVLSEMLLSDLNGGREGAKGEDEG